MTDFSWGPRFLAKVEPTASGCHLWKGGTDKDGYGRFSLGGRNRKASRLALQLASGAVFPRHLEVLHECDTRACVNPAHLKLGTHAENMADMAKRGRSTRRRGEANPRAKLNEADVLAIRASRAPRKALAQQYGLHLSTVYKIQRGSTWAIAQEDPL